MRGVILTGRVVPTRRAVTQVDAILTVRTSITRLAVARVGIDAIYARSTVHATAFCTVFVVGITVYA